MQEVCNSDVFSCRAHLICMSDSRSESDPTVTIVLVATEGEQAVYASTGTWSHYTSWIRKMFLRNRAKSDLLLGKEDNVTNNPFIRNRSLPVVEITIPISQLPLNGFDRVDRY